MSHQRTRAPHPQRAGEGSPRVPQKLWDSQSLALVAVFAALIAASAIVPGIPVGSFGVPITLQTLAVMLTGLVLGGARAAAAVALYLVVAFAGLPIFSGGRAGLQVLAGGSAGYIIGFLLAALLVGIAAQLIIRRLPARRRAVWFFLAATVVSVVAVHTFGALGMVVNLKLSWPAAFAADLVYYPGDILKNAVAAVAAVAVHRAFPDVLVRRVK
ncbi:biotin operon repressor [Sinomonas atrocyanea]|uniref:Biotin transporter n=1 Tax=Sinomonas atrocyanea TaxID=37927 RepID=A0A126ZZN5_9MICC|nr:biotin transporter BioY [Sinomonas atrocyanea]AMM32658.1 biotin operon repressor [Sinomonas atrocyanea]GEB62695.1 biotin transporter BioY [Sinomonas atrocyanea]GGG54032.1 biotin transporter BioY [Sinomonas atrocyanea]